MKRIIFNKIKNKKDNNNKGKTICVSAVAPKLGCTFISLAIANFIGSCLRENVIFIELKEESSLLGMVGENQISIGRSIGYKYKGVKYILTNSVEEAIELLASERGYVIVDLGVLGNNTAAVFNICENKIIIGSFMPWQRRDFHEFIRKNIIKRFDMENIKFCQLGRDKEAQQLFYESYRCRLNNLPKIDNPFSLKEENFEDIINLL